MEGDEKFFQMRNKNDLKIKKFAQENRKEGTKGEAILWRDLLKAKQLGYQFNRQFIIDNFIVDFICRKLKLIIEIDGQSHNTNGLYDFERQSKLECHGYTVIRFSEFEVVNNLNKVAQDIQRVILEIEELKTQD